MQNKPPYLYGGQSFRSLKAIESHIKTAIDYYNRVLGREFFDEVLADVVSDRHYIWRHRGVRPTSFRFQENEDGDGRGWDDSLSGNFGPEFGWHRFSYRKALRGADPDMESEFKRLCRERWMYTWRARLFSHGPCAFPGCLSAAVDVDHINPQQKEIVSTCWQMMSEQDKQEWWACLVGGKMKYHFGMPEGHPVTEKYDQLTSTGTYQLLCKEHHKEETSSRKGITRAVSSIAPTQWEDPGAADLSDMFR